MSYFGIKPEQLEAAGYKAFPSGKGEWCPTGYQKCVRSDDGRLKLYHINFYKWTFPDHIKQEGPGWEAEAALYPDLSGDVWATLGLHGLERHPDPIRYVEAFYGRAFKGLECVPDVHNND